MRQALRTGEVRIFTTPQVAIEVTRDLRFHAARLGANYDAAWKLWNEEYRPRLRVVDVDDFTDTVGQRRAVLAVRQRHPPDAPLALLCELLGVRAWAEDNDLMTLGIGRRDWLKHEVALVDAARLEFLGYSATITVSEGVYAIGKQMARAYRASEAAIGRSATLAILALLALGCTWYLSDFGTARASSRVADREGVVRVCELLHLGGRNGAATARRSDRLPRISRSPGS